MLIVHIIYNNNWIYIFRSFPYNYIFFKKIKNLYIICLLGIIYILSKNVEHYLMIIFPYICYKNCIYILWSFPYNYIFLKKLANHKKK